MGNTQRETRRAAESNGFADLGMRLRNRVAGWAEGPGFSLTQDARLAEIFATGSQLRDSFARRFPTPDFPASRARVGGILGDEAILLGKRSLGARPFADPEIARKEREVAEMLELQARRGWVEEPMAFHSPPQPAAVRFTRHSFGIGAFEQMSFNSDFQPDPEDPGRNRWLGMSANRTAHAWTLRDPQETSRWLLCVPGISVGQPFFDLATFDAVRRQRELGVNVVVYVPPLHGPRKSGWISGARLLESEPLDPIHFMAQAVWDLRRIFAWIENQGGDAVGAYGLGLGANAVALLANLEPKLACVIAGMPQIDLATPSAAYCRQVERDTGEDHRRVHYRLEQLYTPVSALAGDCSIPPYRRYVYAGKRDRVAPIAQARRLHAHWDRPEALWIEGSHTSHASDTEAQVMVDGALIENAVARIPMRDPMRGPTRAPTRERHSAAS